MILSPDDAMNRKQVATAITFHSNRQDCKISKTGPAPDEKKSSQEKMRVVVVGSGFGGTAFISEFNKRLGKRLRHSVELELISETNYHLFSPLLYQVATGLVDSHHILEPVCCEANHGNFRMMIETVRSIDIPGKTIELHSGKIHYDYLVLATGSESNDFGIPGVHEFATPLKAVSDGESIRNRILGSYHAALSMDEGNPARAGLLRFAIVGGGAAGIELAASIRDYIDDIVSYSGTDPPRGPEVVLIEAMDRLMPGEAVHFSQKCRRLVESKGIQVRLKSKVRSISPQGITLEDGSEIRTENVFWTAGIKPGRIVNSLTFPPVIKKKGWIVVSNHLAITNSEDSFAIGDACTFIDNDGRTVPKNAVGAVEEGRYLGRSIAARLKGVQSLPPFSFTDRGTMLALGKYSGIARLHGGMVIAGFWAWLLCRAVHLLRITTVRNKVGVLFDWSFSALHRRILIQTD